MNIAFRSLMDLARKILTFRVARKLKAEGLIF